MKKKRIAFVSTLGLFLHSTACEEKPVASPEINPPEETDILKEPEPPETTPPEETENIKERPIKTNPPGVKAPAGIYNKKVKTPTEEDNKAEKEKPDFKK